MKTAIYPGTFDPITNGHLDIIERAIHLFDKVIVSIARNSDKGMALFTEEERTTLIRQSILEMPSVVEYSAWLPTSVDRAGTPAGFSSRRSNAGPLQSQRW